MLIERLKTAYQEWSGQVETVQPVVAVPVSRPAANAPRYTRSEIQARRLRRQNRQQRGAAYGIHGWSVRTW